MEEINTEGSGGGEVNLPLELRKEMSQRGKKK